ncbi:MAG: hypothetical protein WCK98_07985 [bacterium]
MSSTLSKVVAGLGLFTLTSAVLIGGTSLKANAAGITPTVTPSTQTVSTSSNVTLSFTPVTPITTGSTIIVGIPSGYTGGAALTTSDIAVTGTNITSTVSSGFSATGFTSTLTTSANVTSAVTIVIGGTNKLSSPVAAGNYAFTISTSVGDSGGNFQYVGQANVVLVKAVVPVSLSFAIRDNLDLAFTNSCNMGTLSVASIGSCTYRLKVGSNAASYAISVATSGNFTNGAYSFSNAAAGATGTALTAGTEKYGAIITPGSATNGTAALATAYSAGANTVSYINGSAATLLTVTGQNNPGVSSDVTNTTLVTHNAATSSTTAAGLYTQTVTYTVLPTF